MQQAPTFNLNEAASILGLSRHTLAKHLNEGAPYVTRADRERGVEWQIEIGPLSEWVIERAVNDAVTRYQGSGDGSISRAEADRRRAVAQAITAERDTEEKLRSLVPVADARDMVAGQYGKIRGAMRGIGAQVAPAAARLSSAPAIQQLIDDQIIDTLEDLNGGS